MSVTLDGMNPFHRYQNIPKGCVSCVCVTGLGQHAHVSLSVCSVPCHPLVFLGSCNHGVVTLMGSQECWAVKWEKILCD